MAKAKKPWAPILPSEKDFLTASASTTMLLVYIEQLETTVASYHVQIREMRDSLRTVREEMSEIHNELDRLTGKRIFSLTPDEEQMVKVEKRQEMKAAERARRRIQQQAAAKARTREANRVAKPRNMRGH